MDGTEAEDEWRWIRRCREGEPGAYEPLVRSHEGWAMAYAGAMLGSEDDAADAVQDAFVRAYRSLDRLREGSAFGPWFRTILRNVCLDRLRAPRRTTREEWPPPVSEPSVWNEPIGTRRLEREELAATVRDALDEMTPEHRAALVLKEMDGLSYAEIATALNVPEGTVASRLYHARAALRRVLEARGVSLEDAVR